MEVLRANIAPICVGARLKVKQKGRLPSDLGSRGKRPTKREGLLDREGDDVVAALGVDLGVAARTDDDILLAVHHV
jgi:hypothetical protein